jgi:putative ABC transport system permease protein
LQGFAAHIELGPLSFVGASFLALLVAWSTVGGHEYKVARSSPVEALRYE